jgi:hypothetical protein
MMNGMEVNNQEQINQATATGEYVTTMDDPARTLAERTPTVGEVSRTGGDHAATVGEATIPRPQGSAFQPEKHTLNMRQVLVRFKTAGIERTPRAIQRYCQVRKLDAYFHPHLRVYFVSPESVENLIVTIKKEDERHNEVLFREPATEERVPQATGADSSAHMREESQTMREPSANSREQSHETPTAGVVGERIKELEKQNYELKFELEVEKRVKKTLLYQMADDRNKYRKKVLGFARFAENLKTRLFLLGSSDTGREVATYTSDLDDLEERLIGQDDDFSGDLKTDVRKE